MNSAERLIGFTRMAAKFGYISLSRKLDTVKGQEPMRVGYFFFYSPYAEKLGLAKGSIKEKQLRHAVSAITDFWFRADALLDNESYYKSKGAVSDEERNQVLFGELNIDPFVPDDLVRVVKEIELPARQKARDSHFEFMKKFEQGKSGFEDIMEYRMNTTGIFSETILRVIHAFSDKTHDISSLIQTAINEGLCIQMGDDLIDSVIDYRGGIPNLFYALLLENPEERTNFEAAASADDVVRTKRPYDIARIYAPKTLATYMRRFEDMASRLPNDRRKFVRDSIGFVSHVSFSPHASVKGISLSDAAKMITRRTELA